jgi:hypothetical protein
MVNAGDIVQVTVDHSELGDLVLEAKATEDYAMQKGGYKSADDDGNIGIAGTRIDVKNRYPWSMELTVIAKAGDYDFLHDLMENDVEGDWTIRFPSGDTRTGTGKPVGDLALNEQAGTITVKLQGSGTLDTL